MMIDARWPGPRGGRRWRSCWAPAPPRRPPRRRRARPADAGRARAPVPPPTSPRTSSSPSPSAGDTPATLAARYLGAADRAWMIEDYTGQQAFSPGQEVVIPRRPWNPSGVTPGGYQIVPILTYHNLGEQAKGRLVLAAASFREQMQYLKTNGYRVVSLADFIEFTRLGRQLPQRAVVLTFDDGYRSFKDYAYPVLKELGFTATLFIYTDWVGAGRGSLSWNDLRELTAAGFDIAGPHQDPRRPAPRPGRDRGPVRAAHAGRARAAAGAVQQEPRPAQPRSWPIPTGDGRRACCPRSRSTATSPPSRCAARATPRSCGRSPPTAARSTPR